MNVYGAAAIGVAVGAAGATLLYASLAPVAAERVTVEAVTAGVSELSIPGALSSGIALPLGRRVRAIVARKVAPWTL